MCVLNFTTTFYEAFMILRLSGKDSFKNVRAVIVADFNET